MSNNDLERVPAGRALSIDQFLIGGFRNFVYLVTHGGESLVIDPQSELEFWEKRIATLGSRLVGVALTHTHWDHVAGVPAIAEKYDVPIHVHQLDAARLKKATAAVQRRLAHVSEGQAIMVGGARLEVLHTPGHSAGECCFLIAGEKPALFTGDTVFVGEVGRTDLETGSTAELFATLQRLKRLPPETVVYPGHDYGKTPTSTIARESVESAAFRCTTIEELDALP